MMCIFINLYNLGKLLLVEQLVHEQQKNLCCYCELEFFARLFAPRLR